MDHSSRHARTSSDGTSLNGTRSTQSTTNHDVQREWVTHSDATPATRYSTEAKAITAAATLHQAGYDGTDGKPHVFEHGTYGTNSTTATDVTTTTAYCSQLRWTHGLHHTGTTQQTITT